MTRAAHSIVAVIALLALAGCAQPQLDRDQPAEEPAAEETSDDVTYEFEPISTLDQVSGWPASAATAPYFVSVPIETECHWVEAQSLIGPDIAATIDFDKPASLEGLACGITPSPGSDRDDVVDEVAWRVDEGMLELVTAYAATVFPDGALECEPVEVPAMSPGLSVKYLDKWYVVRPAALACPDTVAQINQAVSALQLTEVLRHTTTFDDYVARGF